MALIDDTSILLLNPPPTTRGQLFLENLGLGHIAASLRKSQDIQSVRVWDCALVDPQLRLFPEVLLRIQPAVVGISLSAATAQGGLAAARMVRTVLPNCRIVLGGVLVRGLSDSEIAIFQPDAIVYGDFDGISGDFMPLLAKHITSRDSAKPMTFGSRHSLLVSQPNEWVWPARDMLGPQLRRHFQISIAASRGCPYTCSFCSIPQSESCNSAWRAREVEDVVEEMCHVHQQFGPRRFYFVDENFLLPSSFSQARSLALAEEAACRIPYLRFGIMCRSDAVDEKTFRELQLLGLDTVFLGLESMSQSQLTRFNKGETPQAHRQSIDILRRLGITVSPGFILADPWSSPDELHESLEGLADLKEPYLACADSRVTCYRGSPMESRLGTLRTSSSTAPIGITEYQFENPWVAEYTGWLRSVLKSYLTQKEASRRKTLLALALYQISSVVKTFRFKRDISAALDRAWCSWAEGDEIVLRYFAAVAKNKSLPPDAETSGVFDRATLSWAEGNNNAEAYLGSFLEELRSVLTAGGDLNRMLALVEVCLGESAGLHWFQEIEFMWETMSLEARRSCAWICGFSSDEFADRIKEMAVLDDDPIVVMNGLASFARSCRPLSPAQEMRVRSVWASHPEVLEDLTMAGGVAADPIGALLDGLKLA